MFLSPFRASAPHEPTKSSPAARKTSRRALGLPLPHVMPTVDVSADINHTVPTRGEASATPQHFHSSYSTTPAREDSEALPNADPPQSAGGARSEKEQFTAFSASTQEILRRIGAAHNVQTNSPEWEAARQQVVRNMAAAPTDEPPLVGIEGGAPAKRARGRGRPPNSMRLGAGAVSARQSPNRWPTAKDETGVGIETAQRDRGRGGRARGVGRGLGRGRHRKRRRKDESDEDDGGEGDVSDSLTIERSTLNEPVVLYQRRKSFDT